MKSLIPLFLSSLLGISLAQSQTSYKLIDLPGQHAVSSIELSPDGAFLAIGTSQGPLYFWDWKTKEVTRTIDVGDYYAGPSLRFSPDGKYLMLQQQYFTDWNLNKDKPGRVEVVEVSSGKSLFVNASVHSASFAAGTKLIALEGNDVCVYDFVKGEKVKCQTIANSSFTVAVSPDGKTFALSKKPVASDLTDIPSLRSDKTAQKEALKRREVVEFYDLEKFTKLRACTDVFDIVYSMRFSDDGQRLFVYNAPHTKLQTGTGRQGYINRIIVSTGEVTRAIYSTSVTEPDFKENANTAIVGNTSVEMQPKIVPVILLCDAATARPLKVFEINVRLGEGIREGILITGRTSFSFLPDNKTVVVGYGGKLALWEPELN